MINFNHHVRTIQEVFQGFSLEIDARYFSAKKEGMTVSAFRHEGNVINIFFDDFQAKKEKTVHLDMRKFAYRLNQENPGLTVVVFDNRNKEGLVILDTHTTSVKKQKRKDTFKRILSIF